MSKTILVVDDSATALMSVRTSLEVAGFRVVTANDGQDALNRLESGVQPDLIITDVNMPVMGGMELIRRVRMRGPTRFTPILTLTTESQQDLRAEAKRMGATGWLVKPVAGADLVKVVKQVLPGT